jgi:hypothetical protein
VTDHLKAGARASGNKAAERRAAALAAVAQRRWTVHAQRGCHDGAKRLKVPPPLSALAAGPGLTCRSGHVVDVVDPSASRVAARPAKDGQHYVKPGKTPEWSI